jgi:DNA replication protein DnaC
MTKFIPCITCASKDGPQPGYYYVEQEGRTFIKECSCHKRWDEEQRIARKLRQANIWNTPYSLDNYVGERSREDARLLQVFIDNFTEKFSDKMIYMYGLNSCQKTTLAMWVGRSLIQKDFSVYYTLMESLSIALTPDFNNESEAKKEIVQKALDADLLIVDEAFDRSKLTLYKSGYQIPFIDRFIRERFEINKKAIIFISNKKPSEIEEQGFGLSLQSLIMRNVEESTLEFFDKYIDNCNTIDRKGLFV